MEVNFIEASDKLKSALKKIENRLEEVDSYNEEFSNLVDIQRDLERVELFLNGMKTENI